MIEEEKPVRKVQPACLNGKCKGDCDPDNPPDYCPIPKINAEWDKEFGGMTNKQIIKKITSNKNV